MLSVESKIFANVSFSSEHLVRIRFYNLVVRTYLYTYIFALTISYESLQRALISLVHMNFSIWNEMILEICGKYKDE